MEHPGVAEAAVVGLPHPDLGEEVAAAVVPTDGQVLDAAALERFCAQRLAHFEVPTRWWIRPTTLPKNDSEKVTKAVLVREWPGS